MTALTIQLSDEAEKKLREKASLLNTSPEVYAAQLIQSRLESQLPGEFELDEGEIKLIQQRVADVRAEIHSSKWVVH